MPVNQVNLNGEELINLTGDTVSEKTLLEGATAHDASGNQITGKVVTVPVDSELNAESENAIQNKAVAEALKNVDAKTVDTQYLAPSSAVTTVIYPACVDSNNSTATAESVKTNDSLRYQMKAGTADATGYAQLLLGNTKQKGTAGNMQGQLVLFGPHHTYYALLSQSTAQTGNANFLLPAAGGTLALNTVATTSANGLMSAADKTKLNSINASGATIYTGTLTQATGTYTINLGVKPKFVLCYSNDEADSTRKWWAKSTSGGHPNITITNTGFQYAQVVNSYFSQYFIALA